MAKGTWIDSLFDRGASGLTPAKVGRKRTELEDSSSSVKVKVDAYPIQRHSFKKLFCRVELVGKMEDFGAPFSLEDCESYSENPLTCPARNQIDEFLTRQLSEIVGKLGKDHPDYVATELDVYRKKLRVRFEFGRPMA